MTTYVYRKGKLVEKFGPEDYGESGGSNAPYVISDTMEPTRHMCDGKYYSSKAKFREVTRAHGCTEVGNDPAILRPRKSEQLSRTQRRDDIRRSIYELRNGRSG